jgi:transglutaminase-like putative cysteine protease
MIYRVTHTTEYSYSEQVPLCHNVIRLRPRDTDNQACYSNEISITPLPAARRDSLDFFGNHITVVSIQEPHDSLRIEARSEVLVEPPQIPVGIYSPNWETVVDMLSHDRSLYAIKAYTFDSPYVPRAPQLANYARTSFQPNRPLLDCVSELTQRIFKEFVFDSGATTIGTPVLEVLEHRHGVCQDFAHLEIGCLRSLGLAARYMSGYIVTHPLPGKQRLPGSDASHAWISVYIPNFGWVEFDPTNGIQPTGEHVTIGWARDYDDISPVDGVIVGGHQHSMFVGVDVEPLPPLSSGEDERVFIDGGKASGAS